MTHLFQTECPTSRLLPFAVIMVGLFVNLTTMNAFAQGVKEIRIDLLAASILENEHLPEILARQIEQRCEAKVITAGPAPLVIQLDILCGNGPESFSIHDVSPGVIRIVGEDERSLLYGIGKFLHTSRYDQGGFTPGTWRGVSKPQKRIRGIYFATHFHNFYHDAPVEEIERYVEELGLWGYNTVMLWYDMHHFDGFDDPKAEAFRSRLRAICMAAKKVNMDVGFGVIANEAYNNSPKELRADPSSQRGGWYDCDVCPAKPGGMDYIHGVLGQFFDWSADLEPSYLWIWPYDQGSCGCAQCRPWGSNGFVKTAKSVAELARQKLPHVEIILSTWMFDDAEWQGLGEALAGEPAWANFLLAEGNIPQKKPAIRLVGFPEISMVNMFPWGGFGATPLPRHFQDQWNGVSKQLVGGFPYSEGIYEDINKVVFSQFYWSDRPAEETLREYIAFEYSPDVVDDVLSIVATLEQNHHMRWWPGELEGVKLEMDWFPSRGTQPQPDPNAEEAFETAKRVDAKLTPAARQAWRWRQVYLRALLDAELKRNHGSPTKACQEAFAELIRIYHAENANPVVRPPLDETK
jgi:hypothetical protein